MKHKKHTLSALLTALPGVILAVGCAVGDGSETGWDGAGGSDETAPVALSTGDEAAVMSGVGAEAAKKLLARLDFADGAYVTFEELGEGVLVTEISHMSAVRHLAGEQTTALAAFKALAPQAEAPPALRQAHERMYPAGATLANELPAEGLTTAPSGATGEHYDEDLEHSGQFEQSGGVYPFASFSSQLCTFSSASPNYIHGNHTGSLVHSTSNVHTAYWAAGSDIGIIGHQACADGNCGNSVSIQPGWQSNSFYDAGQKCTTNRCEWWNFVCKALGEVTVCSPRQVKFDQRVTAISSQVRFHDCARFTR